MEFDTSVKEMVMLLILGYCTLFFKQVIEAVAQNLDLIPVFSQPHLKPTEDNRNIDTLLRFYQASPSTLYLKQFI